MSAFGTEKVGLALIVGFAIAVPIFGWPALIAAMVFVFGWLSLVTDANKKFYPDGTRRRARKNHGRDKRGSRRPGDVADR